MIQFSHQVTDGNHKSYTQSPQPFLVQSPQRLLLSLPIHSWLSPTSHSWHSLPSHSWLSPPSHSWLSLPIQSLLSLPSHSWLSLPNHSWLSPRSQSWFRLSRHQLPIYTGSHQLQISTSGFSTLTMIACRLRRLTTLSRMLVMKSVEQKITE